MTMKFAAGLAAAILPILTYADKTYVDLKTGLDFTTWFKEKSLWITSSGV